MMSYERGKSSIEIGHKNENHEIPPDSIKRYQTSKAKWKGKNLMVVEWQAIENLNKDRSGVAS